MVGCRVGDILLAINAINVTRMSDEEVRHVIATAPFGCVRLTVFPRQTTNVSLQSAGTCKGKGKCKCIYIARFL